MVDPATWLRNHDYPVFSRTRFRGEPVPYTTLFGHDFETFPDRYRFHAATDRPRGELGFWYVPFDCFRVDILDNEEMRKQGFGTLTRLFVADADFELRVAHTYPNEFDATFKDQVQRKRVIKAGQIAGQVGNYGVSVGKTGHHTHLEVVSLQRRSKVLDAILCAKADGTCEDWETEAEIAAKAEAVKANVQQVLSYLRIRGYLDGEGGVGKHDACRKDYLDGKYRTWYDSKGLFNGV